MEISLLWNTVPNLPAANLAGLLFYLALGLCFLAPFRQRFLSALSHPIPTTHTTYSALDTLRGFAAMWVFVGHTFTRAPMLFRDEPAIFQAVMSQGQKAVPIFCVLTGFLIFRSVQKIDSWPKFTGYAQNRMYRIFPLYAAGIALAALLVLAGFPLVTAAPAYLFIFEAFPLQGIIEAQNYDLILGHIWSLYVEIEFYVLAPFIVLVTARIARHGAAALIVSLLLATVYFAFIKEYGGREAQLWIYFIFGILASVLIDNFRTRIRPLAGTALVIGGLLLMLVDGAGVDWASRLTGRAWGVSGYTIGLGIGTTLILIGSITDLAAKKLLSVRPLRILGVVSYSLFVLHPFYLYANFYPIGLVAQNLTTEAFAATSPVMPLPYFALVFIPGMIFIAMLGYVLIERPFLALRKLADDNPPRLDGSPS